MSETEPPVARRRWPKLAVGTLGVGAIAYAGMLLAVGREIPAGVSVAGVPVGRLTTAEASAVVSEYATKLGSRPIKLHAADAVIETTVAELGLGVDVAETVSSLPNGEWNPFALLLVMLRGVDVTPVLDADSKFGAALSSLGREVNQPAVDASIKFVSGKPAVVAASRGRLLDRPTAARQIKAAVAAGLPSAEIDLPMTAQSPVITDAAARKYLEEVVSVAVSAPVIVDVKDRPELSNNFSKSDLRAAIRFRIVNGALRAYVDPAVLAARADADFLAITQPVRDATWDVSSGRPVVVPSQSGFGVSDQALAAAVESVWLQPTERRTSVLFEPLDPKLTTGAIEALGVKELMASYTQRFPAATYRSVNIGRAAELINGTLLMPGATFSMNDTIKERTEENGYTSGWIIGPGGVFQYEPGGGVSTATTATFNAAWFAGLEFLQWRAHSIYISRYPAGREATVSWGSLDMRFRNNYDTAVFITTKMTRTSITVYFWGTRHWDRVGSVFGPRTNQTTAGTVYNSSEKCETQQAVAGFDITVWRTFTQDGQVVKREPFRTRYAASPKVICTAEPQPSPSQSNPKPKPTKPTASISASPTSTS